MNLSEECEVVSVINCDELAKRVEKLEDAMRLQTSLLDQLMKVIRKSCDHIADKEDL